MIGSFVSRVKLNGLRTLSIPGRKTAVFWGNASLGVNPYALSRFLAQGRSWGFCLVDGLNTEGFGRIGLVFAGTEPIDIALIGTAPIDVNGVDLVDCP